MRRATHRRERGQSLVVVALFLGLLFAFMGLAIDGGMLFMQRRLMQNTADSACLAAANQLAIGNGASAATTRAQAVVSDNLGPTGPGTGANAPGTLTYAAIGDVYAANGTTGSDLSRGIEVSGASVRVALQSPASTFFMRVAGIQSYTVSARARCGATAGGGATPFAVARWRGFKTNGDVVSGGPTTDQALPQSYTQGSNSFQMTVRDLLARSSSSTVSQWPGWGAADYPGTPAINSGLYSPPGSPATTANPGYETTIAGSDANSNVPTNTSFTGPIVLDFRNVTYPNPLFYNGLQPTTGLNQYKDYVASYLTGPYPGPQVDPGQQIAYYSGISAGLVQKPFNLRYDVGQIITTVVYNGTIYNTGQSFTLSAAAPNQTRNRANYGGSSNNCSTLDSTLYDGTGGTSTTRLAPASYNIQVTPETYSTYSLRAFLSADPTAWGQLQGSWNGGGYANFQLNTGASSSISTAGGTVNLRVQPSTTYNCTVTDSFGITSTVDIPTRVNGAQSIYVELQDQATTNRRGAYVFLNQNADNSDFFVSIPGTLVYQPLEPGNSQTVSFDVTTVSGTNLSPNGGNPYSVGTVKWYSPSNLSSTVATGSSYQGVTVSFANNQRKMTIDVSSGATTGQEYYLNIPFSYTSGGNTYTHSLWYYVRVRASLNNSQSINQFVYALGYANFRITYVDSNTIRGEAVSGLLRPEQVTVGLQPRLLTWQ